MLESEDRMPIPATQKPPTMPSHRPPPVSILQAWTQVLGAHFLFFNSWGIVNTFGVFQTYYSNTLLQSHSASEISWIGTFQAFLLVSLSLVVGPLFDRGHFRPLIVTGTFLTVFGTMMASLAVQYWQVFLAQGLCVGLGAGCLFLPSVALVATYFGPDRRALAIGVVASGGSLGSVVYPIVFHRLQPRIGFPWAMRVLGFIGLATLTVSIAIMKPRGLPASPSPSLPAAPPAQHQPQLPTAQPPKKPRAMLDLAAFRNPSFALFSTGLFLSFVGLYIPIFYLISFSLTHAHLSKNLSFYTLPILNAASIAGRVIPGLLADRYTGALNMMIFCTLSSAVVAFAALAVDSLPGVMVFAVVYGFLSGAVVSLPSAVVAGIVAPRMEKVGTWMGMSFYFAAVGILIGNPIAGCIIDVGRDRFGGGFVFSGAVVAAAGVCFGAAGLVERKERGKKKQVMEEE